MTTRFERAVRAESKVEIGTYTFTDQDGAAVDLSGYTTVKCDIKRQGATFTTLDATFESKPAGTVHVATYEFTTAGNWVAQFVCDKGEATELYGDPLAFRVVENVKDLDTNETLPE